MADRFRVGQDVKHVSKWVHGVIVGVEHTPGQAEMYRVRWDNGTIEAHVRPTELTIDYEPD